MNPFLKKMQKKNKKLLSLAVFELLLTIVLLFFFFIPYVSKYEFDAKVVETQNDGQKFSYIKNETENSVFLEDSFFGRKNEIGDSVVLYDIDGFVFLKQIHHVGIFILLLVLPSFAFLFYILYVVKRNKFLFKKRMSWKMEEVFFEKQEIYEKFNKEYHRYFFKNGTGRVFDIELYSGNRLFNKDGQVFVFINPENPDEYEIDSLS